MATMRTAALLRSQAAGAHRHVAARTKTSSAAYVAARARDPAFEKLMRHYKDLVKVVAIQDVILASPDRSAPLPLLCRLSQRLRLRRGAPYFLRRFPHIFLLRPSLLCSLTPSASLLFDLESSAASSSLLPSTLPNLVRLLSLSPSRSLPLRALFLIWRELGLPDDFEDSLIARHPSLFALSPNPREPSTHLLRLLRNPLPEAPLSPSVDAWRDSLRLRRDPNSSFDPADIDFAFNLTFPPGMKLSKDYRSKVREWQRLPYVGPYEQIGEARKSKADAKRLEKRAVAIAHEFLSLTVEKMVEVEKISHFRKWFEIELNVRDLFLDHPGIFYLSTKGKRHTIFLREAYERGQLIDPNPIYDARRKLLDLVMLGRRGVVVNERNATRVEGTEEDDDSEFSGKGND